MWQWEVYSLYGFHPRRGACVTVTWWQGRYQRSWIKRYVSELYVRGEHFEFIPWYRPLWPRIFVLFLIPLGYCQENDLKDFLFEFLNFENILTPELRHLSAWTYIERSYRLSFELPFENLLVHKLVKKLLAFNKPTIMFCDNKNPPLDSELYCFNNNFSIYLPSMPRFLKLFSPSVLYLFVTRINFPWKWSNNNLTRAITFRWDIPVVLYRIIKYRQNAVNHNSFNDFIQAYSCIVSLITQNEGGL